MAKVCVVVAAGPGVGQATARRFAREGYAVALLARRKDAMDAVAAGLGGGARGFAADASDAASLTEALAEVAREMGDPSVLVYNASRWNETPGLALTPDVLAYDLRLSVLGALVAIHAVTPAMTAAGGGAIIVTGGGLALMPELGVPVPGLAVGKAAVRALVLSMARPLQDAGIHLATVTIAGTVEPGTPFDPDRIAEAMWEVAAEPPDSWSVERVFRGA